MKTGLRPAAAAAATALLLLISSGCYDIVELDTISIVTGVGIDRDEKPGLIRLTVQVGKAETVGGGGETGKEISEKAYLVLDATDRSIVGALDSLRQDNSRTLFLHHNQLIIFGESHAKDGIADDIDALMRYHQSHMNVYMLVAEGNAREVLDTEMELEKIPSVGIDRMIKNKMEISKVYSVSLLELVSKLIDKSSAAAVPIIKSIKEKDLSRLSMQGLAVFKNGRMVGKLSENQTNGYAWMLGEIKSGSLKVNTGKDSAELNISACESKVKAVFDKNGMPKIQVDINGRFIVEQLIGFEGQPLEEVIGLLNKVAADTVKQVVLSCFKQTQRLNADIFGFGSHIHKYHSRKWKALEGRWEQIYPSLELALNIQTEILDTGKISISPKTA